MSAPQHDAVKQAWQGAAVQGWLLEQDRTDELLRPFGHAAMTTLAAVSGEWILDIGCGGGAPSIELARAVAPSGGVVGVDISEPLLDHARASAAAADIDNLQFVLADAEKHRFERSFHALFSRFGVMFFADPVAAFSNLRHALCDSGRLAFVCWQALERNPWALQPLAAVRAVAPHQPLPVLFQPGQAGPFSMSDHDALYSILVAAGFEHVDITAFTRPLHLGGAMSAEEAADFCMNVGPASRFVADADPALEPQFREAIARALAPFSGARGTWLDAAAYVVSARR